MLVAFVFLDNAIFSVFLSTDYYLDSLKFTGCLDNLEWIERLDCCLGCSDCFELTDSREWLEFPECMLLSELTLKKHSWFCVGDPCFLIYGRIFLSLFKNNSELRLCGCFSWNSNWPVPSWLDKDLRFSFLGLLSRSGVLVLHPYLNKMSLTNFLLCGCSASV